MLLYVEIRFGESEPLTTTENCWRCLENSIISDQDAACSVLRVVFVFVSAIVSVTTRAMLEERVPKINLIYEWIWTTGQRQEYILFKQTT